MEEETTSSGSVEHRHLRVGGASVPEANAKRLVAVYLNTPERHWAYPAYDGYPGAQGPLLGEQDLFAPMMLNAGLRTLRAFYEFKAALPKLNRRLAQVPVDLDLTGADGVTLDAVAHVFGVLDDPGIFGVSMTTLAKTLHRKRPLLIPLWDQNIWWCYRGSPEAPIESDPARTWEQFCRIVLDAVRPDLEQNLNTWQELASLTPPDGPAITPLRALDIVGWRLGQAKGGQFDLPVGRNASTS